MSHAASDILIVSTGFIRGRIVRRRNSGRTASGPREAYMTDFTLHPRLAADTLPVCDLPLSRALLMGDSRFPWLILVPRRPNLREFTDLAAGERATLMEEIAAASSALQRETGAEKMNVGALGNAVAQLHIHVVARFAADAAWPGPVWGSGAAAPYPEGAAEALAGRLAAALGFR